MYLFFLCADLRSVLDCTADQIRNYEHAEDSARAGNIYRAR